MSNEINVELKVTDQKRAEELMSKAIADVIKMKINELPEQLRIKAYDMILEGTNVYE